MVPQTDGESTIAVRTLALRLPPGQRLDPHAHPWGQIIYATEGVMTVRTDEGAWVVPSHRAAWVPAHALHAVEATGHVRMRTVYLREDVARPLPAECRVLTVTPLLRELVLEVLRAGMLRLDAPAQARLAGVLVDQLRATPDAPLVITWPEDPRARRLADAVCANLASSASLEDLAVGTGASVRTLERLFRRETGLTFHRWRQRARLLHALRRLAAGESVTATSLDVGFRGTSAFITMFKRALGTTPGSYFRDPPDGAPHSDGAAGRAIGPRRERTERTGPLRPLRDSTDPKQ